MSQSNHRPRVLLFGSFVPPGEPCGITSSVRGLVGSQLARTYDLEMVSTFGKPSRSLPQRLARGVALGVSATRRMRRDADLVDVHTASDRDFFKHGAVVIAARLARKPVLLRIHGGAFIDRFRQADRAKRALIRRILRLSDRLVTLSRGWRSKLRALDPSLRVDVIPNSIDRQRFARIAEARSADANGVLLLGNLCRDKGHFDLLRAAVGLDRDDFELLFAGGEREPGARRALEQLAAELGIAGRVRFLGPVFDEKLDEVMACAAVFVLPSHIENMPVSIMEAMASGLPVIASTVGAIPEMIEEGVTGRLVPPRDVEQLQRVLGELLDDPDQRARLGRAAFEASTIWDRDAIGALTAVVYAETLGDGPGSAR